MSNAIGANPFSPGIQGPSGTNPFADPAPTEAPARDHGSPAHAGPEGLQGRASMDGGARPRQPLNAAPPGGSPHRAKLDDNTQAAVDMQERQTANNTALAMATAEASIAQGMNEFLKSMAEMQAKSIKSSGEKLSSLS
jgi:hypothetical protein